MEATQADVLRLSAEHQLAQAEIARAERLVEDLQHRLASEMAEKERQLILAESSLRQREEDIARIGQERDEARAEIRDKATQLESVGAILEATQADMLRLSAEHQSAQAEMARGERLVEDLQHRLASEMAEKTQLHDAVSTAVAHAAELMAARERAEQAGREELARHAEAERIAAEHHQAAIGELTRHQEWLGQINAFLRNRPQWWAIMPAAWQRRHEHAALRKRGLFDAEAYLRLYPDVAADGADPVQHYLTHGMAEGRRLIR
ncbi:MAG TPA: hypothetical protein VKQ27_21430 [Acetobacteraceae bacterium]|nr:hypothetical protein [Acetobacteraceae bacterium]